MNNIHIENSYNIWDTRRMRYFINDYSMKMYKKLDAEQVLNRSYLTMYIEWWLHNIGYYVTKPFCHIDFINKINLRCKDVDINELT